MSEQDSARTMCVTIKSPVQREPARAASPYSAAAERLGALQAWGSTGRSRNLTSRFSVWQPALSDSPITQTYKE